MAKRKKTPTPKRASKPAPKPDEPVSILDSFIHPTLPKRIAYDIKEEQLLTLLYWAVERHRIFLQRQAGHPWPWTEDEILRSFSFCNTYREHDRNTRWLRDHLRNPLQEDHRVIFAVHAFRRFNLIDTAKLLMQPTEPKRKKPVKKVKGSQYGLFNQWNADEAIRRLEEHRVNQNKPYTTAAYMIKTPSDEVKLNWLCKSLEEDFEDMSWQDEVAEAGTLRRATEILAAREYMGRFIAYEVMLDLRHTVFLEDAPDINQWAYIGPGAIRGLNRLKSQDGSTDHKGDTPGVSRGTRAAEDCDVLRYLLPMFQETMRLNFDGTHVPDPFVGDIKLTEEQQQLADQSEAYAAKADKAIKERIACRQAYQPEDAVYGEPLTPAYELSDVEGCLCEYDKYTRAAEGNRLKRRYGDPQARLRRTTIGCQNGGRGRSTIGGEKKPLFLNVPIALHEEVTKAAHANNSTIADYCVPALIQLACPDRKLEDLVEASTPKEDA